MFQASIATEFMKRLVKWVQNIKISDPLEEGCRLGPIVSAGQVENQSVTSSIGLVIKLNKCLPFT